MPNPDGTPTIGELFSAAIRGEEIPAPEAAEDGDEAELDDQPTT